MHSLSFAPQVQFEQTLEEAFPKVDPGIRPFGSRVLVQVRTAKTRTKGGIELVGETKEAIQYNTQIALVRALGPLAFRNRQTMELWPEGQWCVEGDFVRVPKYGGDRWERPLDPSANRTLSTEDEFALFVMFNDLDITGKVTIDPRDIIAFV
jgi:co-chaperonin GroES (HSP10)